MASIDLKTIVNYLFKDRHLYKTLSIDDKQKNFFIINKFLSKKYPEIAQKMNFKDIDHSICLDIWFLRLKDVGYPKWFWTKKGTTK